MAQANSIKLGRMYELNGFAWGVETYSPINAANYWKDFGENYPRKKFPTDDLPRDFLRFLDCPQTSMNLSEVDVRAAVVFQSGQTYFISVTGYVTDGLAVYGYRDSGTFHSVVSALSAQYADGASDEAPSLSLVSSCG
jgi:hypothetical protein